MLLKEEKKVFSYSEITSSNKEHSLKNKNKFSRSCDLPDLNNLIDLNMQEQDLPRMQRTTDFLELSSSEPMITNNIKVELMQFECISLPSATSNFQNATFKEDLSGDPEHQECQTYNSCRVFPCIIQLAGLSFLCLCFLLVIVLVSVPSHKQRYKKSIESINLSKSSSLSNCFSNVSTKFKAPATISQLRRNVTNLSHKDLIICFC